MKRYLLLFMIFTMAFRANGEALPGNGAYINLADPSIFYYEGTYYLYGTVEENTDNGFTVYTSTDLQTWSGPMGATNGYALVKENVFGDKGFWAPQVFYANGKFYMAYTANENIAIAESDSPLGPFVQQKKSALKAPVKQIDPYVFIDEDGKKYLYHVRLKEGNRIYGAVLEDDFSGIKENTLRECIMAKEEWENTDKNEWSVAEGPSVFKKDSLYYMLYSANDFRNIHYSVGYAVSKNPLGPWEKMPDSPILSKKLIGKNGTGHGDFFKDKNNKLWYVFHTHNSNSEVSPRKTAIIGLEFSGNKLSADKESFYYLNKSPINKK